MKRSVLLLAVLACALAGCVLAQIVAFPFKLLFEAIGKVGSGLGTVADAVAVVEPADSGGIPAQTEEPLPVLRALDDGRFLVEAPAAPRRFRIRFSAPGRADRVMEWPEDFASEDTAPRADGSPPRVRVLLEACAR